MQQRAECLLTQVRAALGESTADLMQTFDWAFSHDAASRAFGLLGNSSLQQTHRAAGISCRNQLTDETDHELVDACLLREDPVTSTDPDGEPADS